MDWRVVALGLGFALIIEGAAWALFPNQMRRWLARLVMPASENGLRWGGFAALLVGLMVARLGMGGFG